MNNKRQPKDDPGLKILQEVVAKLDPQALLKLWFDQRAEADVRKQQIQDKQGDLKLKGEQSYRNKWFRFMRRFVWVRAALSVLVISAVFGLGLAGKLDGQVLATLLTAAVGSLFLQPKKNGGE